MKAKLFLLALGAVIVSLITVMTAIVLPASQGGQNKTTLGTHEDRQKNPKGCSGCHVAHGQPKTPMLRATPDKLCLICHGPYPQTPDDKGSDIYSSLQKRSHHPILETSLYHERNETLPETSPLMPRHVACYDCHNPHSLDNQNKMGKVTGVSINGQKKVATKASEVCYKCHGDSANRPATSPNIRLLFDPNNQSYHPIERAARRRSVSLFKDMQGSLTIDCTDCHESHGSDYPPLLKKNYTTTEGPESQYAYDLCYSCHRRESILGNESFVGSQTQPYGHREHIVFVKTSCHTCHASHGSQINPSLIEFDRQIVTGPGQYIPGVKGSPTCILTCHGKDHGIPTSDVQGQSTKKK